MSVGTLRSTKRLKLFGSLRSEDVIVPPRVVCSEKTTSTPPDCSLLLRLHQRQPRKATRPISRTLSNARGCRFTCCPIGQSIGRFSRCTQHRIYCDLYADP